MRGININDDTSPYTDLILSGEKTIETRKINTLKSLVGKTVGIIKTGKNKQAMLVGLMILGEPKVYKSKSEFRRDYKLHKVKTGSKYDLNKFGYPIIKTYKYLQAVPIYSRGIVSRSIIL
jgi:hypothetical protein